MKQDEVTRVTNFADYINHGSFSIAIYQREFVWKKEQMYEFLDESIDSYRNKNKIFCGTVYLKDDGSRVEVIDGQQRTTFLYIINDIFKEHLLKSKELLESLPEKDKDFQIKEDLDEINEIIKKTQKFEIDIAREEIGIEERIKKKNNKIGKSYSHLKEHIEKYFNDDFYGNYKNILGYLIHFYKNLELVEIKTNSYETNDVFRSINSKNNELSEWDIMRNEIYKQLNKDNDIDSSGALEEIDEILKEWEKTFKLKKEEFIQSYLIWKNREPVKKNNLSVEFEKNKDPEAAKTLYEFISDNSKIINGWSKISSSDFSNDFKWFLQIINEMKASQVKVYSLAFILNEEGKFSNKIFKELKDLFLNFILYVIIFNERANIFERFFIKLINDGILSNGNLREDLTAGIMNSSFYSDNKKHMKNNKEEFDESISDSKEMLKLYLWLNATNSSRNNTLIHLTDEYEHVLPKNFAKWKSQIPYWEKLDDQEIKEYVNKIGNLILLNKKLNASISNKIYEEKLDNYLDKNNDKTYYFAEGIEENYVKILRINKYDEWTKEVIDERTKIITKIMFEKISEQIFSDDPELMEISNELSLKNDSNNMKEYMNEKNDIFFEIRKLFLKDESKFYSLKEIYEALNFKFEEDEFNERWENIDNFKSVIRRTIQQNCVGMTSQIPNHDFFLKNEEKEGEYKINK